jgi:hypothetical protein
MSQSKSFMVMDFFISCGIEGYAHNFGKPYFESSYYLRWKFQEIKGLLYFQRF